jgi:long-chain acyl-CoA synthetase
MQKSGLRPYPAGGAANALPGSATTLVAMLEDSLRWHRELPALRCMGRSLSYGQLDDLSRAFAAWLQAQGLARGDRVAIMLPNVPQYPVAALAVLRGGFVVVNVNPALAPRELEHQLRDSGAKAVVVLEHFAATLQQVIAQVPARCIVVASMGDLLGPLRGRMIDHFVRRLHRLVPPHALPGASRFNAALAQGARLELQRAEVGPDDIALLQYTGGTTATARGAVLLHRNVVANIVQNALWHRPALERVPAGEQLTTVGALPLCHIFGFVVVMLLGLHLGGCCLLVPNPQDARSVLRVLRRHRVHSLPGVGSLFDAIALHPEAERVDWSSLVLCVGGGMAVRESTARRWQEHTGCSICEGYGLTEAGPSVTCNPVDAPGWSGSIGLPLPGTEVRLLDDDGASVGIDVPGEIAIRGPQVCAGYWQRPDETARVMTSDGFLRTGDVGIADASGRLRIVDRKKDRIHVRGFAVYPNEIEEVLAQMPGVLEAAAVGVPDARAGEAVKVVVVKHDPAVTEADVQAFCETHLSGPKRPRVVEFRSELPRSAIGRVLRRELRAS